jgi:hypothetical protein
MMDGETLKYLTSVRDRLDEVLRPQNAPWSAPAVFDASFKILKELDTMLDAEHNAPLEQSVPIPRSPLYNRITYGLEHGLTTKEKEAERVPLGHEAHHRELDLDGVPRFCPHPPKDAE